MLKRALAVVALVAVASASVDDEFNSWSAAWGKVFSSPEQRATSLATFRRNSARLAELKAHSPSATFQLNQFADQDESAFLRTRAMPPRAAPEHAAHRYARPSGAAELPTALPASWDWRDKGAVTPVQDQGSIGSCWAFSTVQNIEGVHFLAGNPLTPLSAEQLVDCDSTTDGAHSHADCGPFGGWPYLAYSYVLKVGGLDSAADVPYCAGDGSCFPCPAPGYNDTLCGPPVPSCNTTRNTCGTLKPAAARISSWRSIGTDEQLIAQEMLVSGPLSVLLNAGLLQFYSSGIIQANPTWCDPTALDHAVLLVGFGTDATTKMDYWIVKNSWGASWGLNGYFLLQRGAGACGINTAVTTAIA